MYNHITVLGHLSKDITLRYLPSGSAVSYTSIASNNHYTHNGEKVTEVTFIPLEFFGRSAENANKFLRKGSKLLVEGRLKQNDYVDKNGIQRYGYVLKVASFTMLDSKYQSEQPEQPSTPNVVAYDPTLEEYAEIPF